MADITPRDALEVVRRLIGNTRTMAGLTGDPVMRQNLRDGEQALATLSALVERAGEPVAVIRSPQEPYGTRFLPEEWDRLENLTNGTRLIAIPPTAPGASHER